MGKQVGEKTSCRFDLSNYQGVIFDLDGTLVDSSQTIIEVLTIWCDKHKISLDSALHHCHGARIVDFLPELAPHLEVDQEVRALAELEVKITTGLVEITSAKLFLELLIDKKLKWAIATSGTHDAAKFRLRHCELPIPEVFITSELVQSGKPDPEPFLLAANQLAVNPKYCLAFEDSDAGITSAIAAGCDVVVIGKTSTIQHNSIVARVDDYYSLMFSEKIVESV